FVEAYRIDCDGGESIARAGLLARQSVVQANLQIRSYGNDRRRNSGAWRRPPQTRLGCLRIDDGRQADQGKQDYQGEFVIEPHRLLLKKANRFVGFVVLMRERFRS